MINITQKVGMNGRISIPKEIRDLYHINQGDTVVLIIEDIKHSKENTKEDRT